MTMMYPLTRPSNDLMRDDQLKCSLCFIYANYTLIGPSYGHKSLITCWSNHKKTIGGVDNI